MWKDWESPQAIRWPQYLASVRDTIAAATRKRQRIVVVEGFLLLAHPESAKLLDAVVSIEITKGVAWARRKGRALSMAHLPPGAGENTNYEVLEVYTREGDDRSRFSAVAARLYPEERGLAWLRLYFEECVWPAALSQQRMAAALPQDVPVLRLDGDVPEGSQAWAAARVPEVVAFVQRVVARG